MVLQRRALTPAMGSCNRILTTVATGGGPWCWSRVRRCWNQQPWLLQPAAAGGGDGDKCWRSGEVFLLEPRRLFAGTSSKFCYHRLRFLLEPTRILLLRLFFAGTSIQICYHHLRFLLELTKILLLCFFAGTLCTTFCYNSFGFCYYRRSHLLHPFS